MEVNPTHVPDHQHHPVVRMVLYMRLTKNIRQALYNLAGVFLLRILMSPHCQTQLEEEEEVARDPLRGPARRRPEGGRRCGGTTPCGSGRRQVRAWVAYSCFAGKWDGSRHWQHKHIFILCAILS